MFTVYEVKALSDMTEGRGGYNTIKVFEREDEAWKFANSKSGVMGRRPPSGDWRDYSGGRDWNVTPLKVWESNEYSEEAEKRQKALSKLTPEEIKLLGL